MKSIQLLSYEEYIKYDSLYKKTLSKEVFEKYQLEEKAPMKFFKIRSNFDIVYFMITPKNISFINCNIYKKNFLEVKKLFNSIANLDILKGYFFYDSLYMIKKGIYEDFIDVAEEKSKFIASNIKFIQSFHIANIMVCNTKVDELCQIEENRLYDSSQNLYIVEGKQHIYYSKIDEKTIILNTIRLDRMEESQIINYIDGIKKLQKRYSTIFSFAFINSEESDFYIKNGFDVHKEYNGYLI